MISPFEPILDNPFVPKEFGAGGFNSGKKLEEYNYIDATGEEREKVTNVNSQRTYRNRNRGAYNANQNKLWKANKESNTDSYQTWKASQAIANKNYRLNNLIANPNRRTVEIELKRLWSGEPKRKGRRKKNAPTAEQEKEKYFKDNYEKAKLNVVNRYKKEKQALLEKYPDRNLGDGNKFELNDDGTRKNWDYEKYNPTAMRIGKSQEEQTRNKTNLDTYYESVLTTIKPKAQVPLYNELGQPNDYLGKRQQHRNALNAGEWTLDATHKKVRGNKVSSKVGTKSKHPYEI
jgi:hypothetical protein